MLTPKGTTGINENHECFIALSLLSFYFIAERASGAPLLSKFGNLSMRQILVVTSACARPPAVQTLGEGKGSPKTPRRGWRMPSFLGGNRAVLLGRWFLCVCVVVVGVVVVVVGNRMTPVAFEKELEKKEKRFSSTEVKFRT